MLRLRTVRPACRAGVTLLELLVVVAILVILLAATVPLIRPGLENRKVREAARMTSAFILGAQAKAARSGKSVGVWIEPDRNPAFETAPGSGVFLAATKLYYAETPGVYQGDVLDARTLDVVVSYDDFDGNGNDGEWIGTVRFPTMPVAHAATLATLLAVSAAQIQFNHSGPYYDLAYDSASMPPRFTITHPYESFPPLANVSAPDMSTPPRRTGTATQWSNVPFRVTRYPIRSAASVVSLPTDTVIDFSVSGTGARGRTSGASLLFVFDSQGQVTYSSLGAPTDVLHLLVGRADQVNPGVAPGAQLLPPGPDVAQANLADGANFWVSVNPRTGGVATSENAGIGPYTADLPNAIQNARSFARRAESTGGR